MFPFSDSLIYPLDGKNSGFGQDTVKNNLKKNDDDKNLNMPPKFTTSKTHAKGDYSKENEETKHLKADINKLTDSVRRVSVALFELQLLLDNLNRENISRTFDEESAKKSIDYAVDQAIKSTTNLNDVFGVMTGSINKLDEKTRSKIQEKVDEFKESLKKLNEFTQASLPVSTIRKKSEEDGRENEDNNNNKNQKNVINKFSEDSEESEEV